MISEIQIENFKSIAKLNLKLGNVTVLIGENGSGKSNILEAIAFGAAASVDKLDDEFLYNRGIRVTDKEWMVSAFKGDQHGKSIFFKAKNSDSDIPVEMDIDTIFSLEGKRFGYWEVLHLPKDEDLTVDGGESESIRKSFIEAFRSFDGLKKIESDEDVARFISLYSAMTLRKYLSSNQSLKDFLIYAPENTALRKFESEGAIKPLGIKGEGLLKLLTESASDEDFFTQLKSNLKLLGWFDDLRLPTESDGIRGRLRIQDRWLPGDGRLFDQRSANEGFLYLLFYFTLFLSKETPKFFAIDNIDNALNPKLCSELIRQLGKLAEANGKQVICTTHSPAILDGLNLHNDNQKLYVVRRNSEGHTVVNQVKAPRPRPDGEPPVKLSTAFMSGLLGGVPDHF
jgi:AAA15 family ATPase/GTPase